MPIVEATSPGGKTKKQGSEAGAPSAGHAAAEKTAMPLTDLDSAPTGWADKIAELKKNTLEARAHRQKLAKDLKAAQRKSKRLKERARFLSEEDMVQILMKRAKTAAAKEEVANSASSSSKGETSDKSPMTGQADGETRPEEEDEVDVQDRDE